MHKTPFCSPPLQAGNSILSLAGTGHAGRGPCHQGWGNHAHDRFRTRRFDGLHKDLDGGLHHLLHRLASEVADPVRGLVEGVARPPRQRGLELSQPVVSLARVKVLLGPRQAVVDALERTGGMSPPCAAAADPVS